MMKVISGNEAAAYGAMLSRPQVVCAYPITPQSQIPEKLSEFCAQGLLKAKFVNVESEIAALGYVISASSGGVRVFTATSSLGLALMHEQLHWASDRRLPVVMAEVNRALPGGPFAIELKDTLSQRDTGWMQFYCESNQEILDTIIQAYRVSESVALPSMVVITGVFLSYLYESVDIPEQVKVDAYLPRYEPKFRTGGHKFYQDHPGEQRGGEREGMPEKYELHKAQEKCVPTVLRANEEFEALFGRGYPPVEEYKCEDADVVVVMIGSAVGTGRYVIDRLREKGYKVGLVKMKMFRPFPKELVRKALGGRKKIAVIERDCIPGQGGIVYHEIKAALYRPGVKGIPMYGFIAGLGGVDISPRLIEKAILFTMENDPPEKEVIWLGLGKKERGEDEDDRNYIKIQ